MEGLRTRRRGKIPEKIFASPGRLCWGMIEFSTLAYEDKIKDLRTHLITPNCILQNISPNLPYQFSFSIKVSPISAGGAGSWHHATVS